MVPKTCLSLVIPMLMCVGMPLFSNNPIDESTVNNLRPSLRFDFDECVSFAGGSSADYSEFTASSVANTDCSEISVLGGNLFRINPNANQHSCAPGMNGTRAMCIDATDFCNYNPGDQKSLLMTVMVHPGPDGLGSIDNISFFSRAPETFQYLEGASGPNNYPTRLGIRVIDGNGTLFETSDIPTNEDWTFRYFDLSNFTTVTEPTLFRIEILPYCPVGIDADVQAWDIEDLVITGGCNNVNGGNISTTSNTDLCSATQPVRQVAVDVQNTAGQNFNFLVVDEQMRIRTISSSNIVDFTPFASGNFQIFHLASEGPVSGLTIGSFVFDLVGCFDLSNPIAITNRFVTGGRLLTSSGFNSISICPNNNNGFVNTQLQDASGENVTYVLLQNGRVLDIFNSPSFDLSRLPVGNYNVTAISASGPVSNIVIGGTLTNLTGCASLSSPLLVEVQNAVSGGGMLTSAGQTSASICGNENSVDVVLTGNSGQNNDFILVNPQNRILSIQNQPNIFVGNLVSSEFQIFNISYNNGLTGLVVDGLLSNLEGCFELSNPIDVIVEQVSAGMLTSFGSTEAFLCLKNDDRQAVVIETAGQFGQAIQYFITDEFGVITETAQLVMGSIDFDNALPGVCQIWAVASNGPLFGVNVGQNINNVSGPCFDISNPIRVFRNQVESGVIDGPATQEICLNDQPDQTIEFNVTGNESLFSSFIVADSAGDVLLIDSDGTIDFEGIDVSPCFIYHIAHVEEQILFDGIENVNNISLACFELSESVSISKGFNDGGVLRFSEGGLQLTIAAGTTELVEVTVNDDSGPNSSFLIIDEDNNIIRIQTENEFDFSQSAAGTCTIRHLSYSSIEGLELGESFTDLTGCFDLSNRVTVTKDADVAPDTLDAGIIVFEGGLSESTLCVIEGSADQVVIEFQSDPVGPFSSFIVTDNQGEILALSDQPTFDFSGAGPGVCNIYSVVHDMAVLSGLEVGNNLSDLSGTFELSEPIVIDRDEVDGGTIETSNNETTVSIIIGDGLIDSIDVNLSDAIGDNQQWVITDTLANILDLPDGPPFTFEESDDLVCQIWSLSFADGLLGAEVGNNVSNLEGCLDLSSPITVVKEEFIAPPQDTIAGGLLTASGGLTALDVCLGTSDTEVQFDLIGAVGDTMRLVITDENGMILAMTDADSFDFEPAGPGICLVYNISWAGMIDGLSMGEDVADISGNFELSNAVTVVRNEVVGGVLMSADSMTSSVSVIVGDGIVDSIDVDLQGAIGDNLAWVITDTLGVILDLPSAPPFTFEDSAEGVCQIWNLSFANGISGAEIGNNVSVLEGCFSLSNPIQVTKVQSVPVLSGGVIMTLDSMSFMNLCLNNNNVEVDVLLEDAVGENMAFAITDTMGFIFGVFSNPPFQFSGLPAGTCEIVHVSYNGMVSGLDAGQNLDTLSGDFDLSNIITVFREDPIAGMISTPTNQDSVSIIVGDGIIDSIDVVVTGANSPNTAWVITDTLLNILELPSGPPFVFENSGAGVCQIWHLGFGNVLSGVAIDANVSDLEGCFDLSNPITVTKTEFVTPTDTVSGGVLTTLDSLTNANLCFGGGVDSLGVILLGALGDTMTFAITDTAGLILDLVDTAPFDFSGVIEDTCLIYNVSWNEIDGLAIGEQIDALMGDFALSNVVIVAKEQVDGGVIETVPGGMTEVSVQVGDMMPDSIDVSLSMTVGDSLAWVITDDMGNILELPDGPPFEFDNQAPGVCQIWNLSYATGLTGVAIGDNVSDLDGCFDLSNPITVTKTTPPVPLAGGDLMTSDSLLIANLCVGTLNDTLGLILEGAIGPNMTFVVTDSDGVILDTTTVNPISFATSTADNCEVRNLSWAGMLNGLVIGENIDTLAGMFEFSNPVFVVKDQVNGGVALFEDMSFVQTIIIGDGMPDTLNFGVTAAVGDSMTWVLTDNIGTILEISGDPQFIISDTTNLGSCNIVHAAFAFGLQGLEINNNINIGLDGCVDLSNVLVVNKMPFVDSTLVAGAIMTTDSLTTVDLCTGDNGAQLDFILTGANGPESVWVVTDSVGIITSTFDAQPIIFSPSNDTLCMVSHIVFDGQLAGLDVGEDIDTLSGNFLSSNIVTVNKNLITSSSITLTNSAVDTSITTVDGITDTLVVVSSGIVSDTSVYITTTPGGIITAVQDSATFLFDIQPTGTCLIYEVSYDFEFPGVSVNDDIADLIGCFALSNAVTVNKISSAQVNGGTIFTPNGNNIDRCLNNLPLDSVTVTLVSAVGDSMQWVVTDTFGLIVALQDGPSFAFDTLPAGVCEIHHVSFVPPIMGLEIDGNINNLSGIFDFADLPVTVDRNFTDAGSITTAAGMPFDTISLGADPIDSLFVNLSGNILGDNTDWIITDTLGIILELPGAPPFDFENFPPGECNVWHIAFADGLSGLEVSSDIASDLDGCFSLSDSIRIVKTVSNNAGVNSGLISTLDGTNVIDLCRGSLMPNIDTVLISGQTGSNFSFFVTNQGGLILNVLDTTQMVVDTAILNLDLLPNSSQPLNLYYIAYEDGLENLEFLSNISELNGFFDLSNIITVNNEDVDAGFIISNPDTISIVVGDGIIDTIDFQVNGGVGDTLNWLVYDTTGVILEIDSGPPFTFEESGGGIFNIARINYLFGLDGLQVGNNLTDITGCFEIMDEPLTVVATQATIAGGSLMTTDSTTIVNTCLAGAMATDTIDVILTDTLGMSFAWVITTPDGSISELPAMPPFVFDSSSPDTCIIQNVSFEGMLTGLAVGENIDTLMGDFLLSNPVTVFKDIVNGGVLSSPSGNTSFEFCVGDGNPDILNVEINGAVGSNLAFVVTDTLNDILLLPPPGNNFVDFEGFGDGQCRLYHMSSNDEILGLVPGANIDSLVGCLDFSNFLSITKNGVDGSIVITNPPTIDAQTFCVSDGLMDTLLLSTNSTMGSYQYVITDENNEIDSVLVGDFIDFEGSDFGTCLIWGVSFTGTFIGVPGDTVGIQDLASECWDVSTAPITVIKEDCSEPLMTEIMGNNSVEIQNFGTAPTDISNLFLVSELNSEMIGNLPLVCGSTNLMPGDIVVVDLTGSSITIDGSDGEMALFNGANVGSSDDILHYVEWASTPHDATLQAVIAQIWMNNQFAVSFDADESLKYDGEGFLDTDWSVGTPTPCMENVAGETPEVSRRLDYITYPNPSINEFTLFIPELPTGETARLELYDSFGKIIFRKEVSAGIEYNIDLTPYGTGMYYTKVISGYQGVVKKMLILE